MAESLKGTVALVTGASSGIGQAVALRLAKAGAAIAIVARRQQRLEGLATEIGQRGGKAIVLTADISNAEQSASVVARTIQELGRLDTVVNAAGLMLNGPTLDASLVEWDSMIATNLNGLLYLTKAALPHLLAAVQTSPRQVSDVVNISSVAGRVAAPTVAVYNATKFGVTAATESWRQEFTKQSLRFSVVEPGATATELFEQKAGQWEGFTQVFGEVERLHADDIAEAVAFIVSSPRRVAINEIVIRPTDQA